MSRPAFTRPTAASVMVIAGTKHPIEIGFWGTIQKFAIAGARHRGTEAQRAQVQNSYADYKRWLAEEMAADAL